MKVLTPILCLLFFTASGQPRQLVTKTDISTNGKDLVIKVTVTNSEEKTLFINTSNFYVATSPSDSLNNNGLLGLLKSQSGEFIPYSYPVTFIQMENVKKEAKRSDRINKRQQPKIKISPSDNLMIEKGTSKLLTIQIPLKFWTLSKGEKYNLEMLYSTGTKELTDNNHLQVRRLRIDAGQFTY